MLLSWLCNFRNVVLDQNPGGYREHIKRTYKWTKDNILSNIDKYKSTHMKLNQNIKLQDISNEYNFKIM